MADFCYAHTPAAARAARNVSAVAVGPMRGQAKWCWPPSAWITLSAITSKWRPSARCRCFLPE